MSKVDAQFLHQRRLPVVPLGREGGEPPGPQATLLAHPPADTTRGAEAGILKALLRRSASEAVAALLRRLWWSRRCAGGGVRGRVELEVLGAALRGVGALLLLRGVVVGHNPVGRPGRGKE